MCVKDNTVAHAFPEPAVVWYTCALCYCTTHIADLNEDGECDACVAASAADAATRQEQENEHQDN